MRDGVPACTRNVLATGRARYGRAVRLLLTLSLALATATAAAQPRHLRVDAEGPEADALREAGRDEGWTPVDEPSPARPEPSREAVAALAHVETLIAQARAAATRLREGEALDALAEARAILERHARTPGVGRWLAEVELTTGVVAHQQGRHALAEQSLGRAASLDPARRLGAAEAPPPVVQRAQELARAAATRPVTELVLRSEAPGARAFLDDRALGPLPTSVEVGVGRHVLRIEAPGHRPWGRVVDLMVGRGRPWDVTLSPTEAESRRRRIAAASLDELPGLLDGGEVLLVAPREGRALVTRCTAAGCTEPEPRALEAVFAPSEREALSPAQVAEAWARALASLDERPSGAEVPTPPTPWWRRGSTWVAVALGAVVAGVALGFSLRPDVRQQRVFVFDYGTLTEL